MFGDFHREAAVAGADFEEDGVGMQKTPQASDMPQLDGGAPFGVRHLARQLRMGGDAPEELVVNRAVKPEALRAGRGPQPFSQLHFDAILLFHILAWNGSTLAAKVRATSGSRLLP